MKRIITIAAAIMIAVPGIAQENNGTVPQTDRSASSFNAAGVAGVIGGITLLRHAEGTGIVAGMTSSSTSFDDIKNSTASGFHVGVMTKIPLFLGFGLQPGIIYNVKGTSLKDSISNTKLDTSVGYLEIPVQVQWGINIGQISPYVFAEPFVGFALNTDNKVTEPVGPKEALDPERVKDKITNNLEHGLGVGAGVELFSRVQVMGKYFWNMGNLYKAVNDSSISESFKEAVDGQKSFNGFTVSVAFFF